jgi:hypothetical protein
MDGCVRRGRLPRRFDRKKNPGVVTTSGVSRAEEMRIRKRLTLGALGSFTFFSFFAFSVPPLALGAFDFAGASFAISL